MHETLPEIPAYERSRAIKKLKCPACGHRKLLIEEVGTWITQHEWNGNKCTGHNNSPGEYFEVWGNCNRCLHRWKFRNMIQFNCRARQEDRNAGTSGNTSK